MLTHALDLVRDPLRLGRFVARLVADPRVPASAKAGLAGSAVYVWVNGDLISDTLRFVLGLGYLDDVALLVHAVRQLVAAGGPEVALELWPGDEASLRRTMLAVVWLDDQLYGRARALVRALLGRLLHAILPTTPPLAAKGA